jgi:hypothetical protein
MEEARQALVGVLREAIGLLSLPGNDFAWSSWKDANQAIGELNGMIKSLESGATPRQLVVTVLFAPTGPMQETSMSSGWAYEYLALAERFDAAAARVYGPDFEIGTGGL